MLEYSNSDNMYHGQWSDGTYFRVDPDVLSECITDCMKDSGKSREEAEEYMMQCSSWNWDMYGVYPRNVLEDFPNPNQGQVDIVKQLIENNYVSGFQKKSLEEKVESLALALAFVIDKKGQELLCIYEGSEFRGKRFVLTLSSEEIARIVAKSLALYFPEKSGVDNE